MLDARDVDRIVRHLITQYVGSDGNELAKTIIRRAPAIWEVGKTVAGIYQSLNEQVSSLRIEPTKISTNRL